ncbi:MAG TPA: TMEM175 family protein [Phototrophicaceae bacterium]|nr:TMEM175 family protein [Phototrophicaceae bacterium]
METKQGAEKETGRIEAFSDGVFAIAITLLVLNISVPSAQEAHLSGLIASLIDRWPTFLALIASFFFILVMWINHHRLFTAIRRSDTGLMLLNGLLLFGVILVPFWTALVAQFLQQPDETLAVMIYNGWFVIVSIFFNLLWRYAAHDNRLFSEQTDRQLVAAITRQYNFGPPLYMVTVLLALLQPMLGIATSFAMAVFFAIPSKAVQQLTASENVEQNA